jgi:hypothetical protein
MPGHMVGARWVTVHLVIIEKHLSNTVAFACCSMYGSFIFFLVAHLGLYSSSVTFSTVRAPPIY